MQSLTSFRLTDLTGYCIPLRERERERERVKGNHLIIKVWTGLSVSILILRTMYLHVPNFIKLSQHQRLLFNVHVWVCHCNVLRTLSLMSDTLHAPAFGHKFLKHSFMKHQSRILTFNKLSTLLNTNKITLNFSFERLMPLHCIFSFYSLCRKLCF